MENETKIPGTYGEAMQMGYEEYDFSLERGYVSRRTNMDKQRVYKAGGRRRGELYVYGPRWDTTVYCSRIYIRIRDPKNPALPYIVKLR